MEQDFRGYMIIARNFDDQWVTPHGSDNSGGGSSGCIAIGGWWMQVDADAGGYRWMHRLSMVDVSSSNAAWTWPLLMMQISSPWISL